MSFELLKTQTVRTGDAIIIGFDRFTDVKSAEGAIEAAGLGKLYVSRMSEAVVSEVSGDSVSFEIFDREVSFFKATKDASVVQWYATIFSRWGYSSTPEDFPLAILRAQGAQRETILSAYGLIDAGHDARKAFDAALGKVIIDAADLAGNAAGKALWWFKWGPIIGGAAVTVAVVGALVYMTRQGGA